MDIFRNGFFKSTLDQIVVSHRRELALLETEPLSCFFNVSRKHAGPLAELRPEVS